MATPTNTDQLIQAIRNELDAEAKMTPRERELAKKRLHGLLYGIGPSASLAEQYTAQQALRGVQSIAQQLQVSASQAYQRQYRAAYAVHDPQLDTGYSHESEEITRLRGQIENLTRRFSSLFKIPLDEVKASLEDLPDASLEKFQIRISVEAFDVVCSMGELASARLNPGFAETWSREHIKAIIDHISREAARVIFQRILQEGNKITAEEQTYRLTDETSNEE